MKCILNRSSRQHLSSVLSRQVFARAFSAKAHTIENAVPYYPYPKPDTNLDADDWDSRPFEDYKHPRIPAWGETDGDWVSSTIDPAANNKKFYDIFAPKEKHQYTRTKPYSLKKQYTANRLKTLIEGNEWLVVLQHTFSTEEFLVFEKKANELSQGRIKMKTCIKNSLARRACENGPYEKLGPLFSGPTVVAYANDKESILQDIHCIIDLCPPDKALLLGAKVQDGVATYQQIRDLKKLKALDTLMFDLITTINQPLRTLVQTMQFPTNSLIKTLDFQKDKLAGPGEDAAEETGPEATESATA